MQGMGGTDLCGGYRHRQRQFSDRECQPPGFHRRRYDDPQRQRDCQHHRGPGQRFPRGPGRLYPNPDPCCLRHQRSVAPDGTGQTNAIVDAYDDPSIFLALGRVRHPVRADLVRTRRLYQQYGPASSFLTVLNQNGQATSLPAVDPSGAGTDNWEVEEALDVEWAHAIAPGAQIVLVEANSQSLPDLMSGVATAAAQPRVSVVSMSWGFAEGQQVFAADEAMYDSDFQVPGVTFVASTGDYGGRSRISRVLTTQRGVGRRHQPHLEWGQLVQQRDGVGLSVGFGGGLHRLGRRHQPV